MLTKRLATGLTLILIFVAVIIVDERLAPWFPFWFVLVATALGKASLELVGLLNRTSARPSGNTVLGGVLALVVANWVPHLIGGADAAATGSGSAIVADPAYPALVFSWTLWVFATVVMFTFIAQSTSFTCRAGRWRGFRGRCWRPPMWAC